MSPSTRKGDTLRAGSDAFVRRQAIWYHNHHMGSARMMEMNLRSMVTGGTTTMQTSKIAQKILTDVRRLQESLKTRAWPPMAERKTST